MGLMTGKKGIVFGVANERSYAYFIAQSLIQHGAEVGFTFLPMGKMEQRVGKAVKKLGIEEPWLVPCDANDGIWSYQFGLLCLCKQTKPGVNV